MKNCNECGARVLTDADAIDEVNSTGGYATANGHWHDAAFPQYATHYRKTNGILEYYYSAPWQIGGSHKWQSVY